MIYHYSNSIWLPSIMATGLTPKPIELQPGEKAVLWFTLNPKWENTIFLLNAPSLQKAHVKMSHLGHWLVRIGCDESVAPYTREEITELAATPSTLAAALYETAIIAGSRPGEWRGTLEDVPPEKFKVIERYN